MHALWHEHIRNHLLIWDQDLRKKIWYKKRKKKRVKAPINFLETIHMFKTFIILSDIISCVLCFCATDKQVILIHLYHHKLERLEITLCSRSTHWMFSNSISIFVFHFIYIYIFYNLTRSPLHFYILIHCCSFYLSHNTWL